jgi:uncharacterized protein YcgL (UPF0745 family)
LGIIGFDRMAAAKAGKRSKAALPFPFTAFAATIAQIPRRRVMQAFVYRSGRKPDTYLYLREKDAFAIVPDAVRLPLGPLELVLEVALTPERRLARADAEVVRANLERLGYYLQAPPNVLDPLVAGGVGDG